VGRTWYVEFLLDFLTRCKLIVPLGFDNIFPWVRGEKKIRRQKRAAEMFASVAEWLFREVYA
jgi:hypothetical protein